MAAPQNTSSFNLLSPLISYGVASIKASNVRTQYNTAAAKLNPTDKQGRVDLKERARANTPEPFKSIVEKNRPIAGEKAKVADPNFKGNAAKTNIEVNEVAKTTGNLGRIFIGAGIVHSGYTIATSNIPIRETITEGAGWAGAIYGGGQAATFAAPAGPYASAAAGFIGSAAGFFFGKQGSDAVINALPAAMEAGAGNTQRNKEILGPSWSSRPTGGQ